MFQWLAYKKRLQAVRQELVAIAEECETLPIPPAEPPAVTLATSSALGTLAKSTGAIARILVRVVDSLPG